MTYQLVLFDFDGTLANTFPLFLRLLNEIADEFRFRTPASHELDALRRMNTAGILASLGVPRWKLPAILRHARARMAQERDGIELFNGITPLLQSLARRDVRLAIVSSNSEATVRAVLGAPLCESIHTFACGVGLYGKAAKIRTVLARARVSQRDAAFVGDEQRDVAAARRAGVTSVAVTWGYASESALSPAHVLCRSIDDLEQALAPRVL